MQQCITAQEFSFLIEPYHMTGRVAVAVSGGRDSMALALLMNEWCQISAKGNAEMVALTIDHQLRPESAWEAETVHQWFIKHKIPHFTLKWDHDLIESAIQKKARIARYELLKEWCHNNQVTTLMTAHHLHDQWETFMMRLSKASGLSGLCGIRACTDTSFGRLIRPLLSIEPERLELTLERFNQPFIEDPSNQNEKFTRIRWRALLPVLSKDGLTPDSIGAVINRLQDTESYIQDVCNEALKNCVVENKINLSLFRQLPQEIAYRLLTNILRQIGKHEYPLPYESLKRLYLKLQSPDFKGATAGGCYLKRIHGGLVAVSKENRE